MKKAKKTARMCAYHVERLCGGKYARMVREVMREDGYRHPRFLAVVKGWDGRVCARITFEEVGEVWDMPVLCEQRWAAPRVVVWRQTTTKTKSKQENVWLFAAGYGKIEVQKGGTKNVSKNFEKWRRDH